MAKVVIYIFLAIIIISFLRSVIGIIAKAIGGYAEAGKPGQSGASGVRSGGELRRDPVCGTYVSVQTDLKAVEGKQVYYFCSAECRDKFSKKS